MAQKLTQRDVSVTKKHPSGAWEVAAVVDNHRVSKTYYGYSKRDAIRMFIEEINFFQSKPVRSNPGVRELNRYNSYEALDGYLGNRDERKIANNTTAVRLEEIGGEGRAIAIILHHTKIVTFYEHGGVTLNSGGYRTVTTKQRINQFLPPGWRLTQEDYNWMLYGRGPNNEPLDLEFYDGIGIPTREGFPPRRENPMRGERGHHRGPSPDDSYPSPGKFEGERMLAVEMYDAAMESGADEEEGDSEGPGYFWLFTDFIASDGTPRHGILSENSQGFISLTEYDTATDATEAWEDEILPMLDEFFEEE